MDGYRVDLDRLADIIDQIAKFDTPVPKRMVSAGFGLHEGQRGSTGQADRFDQSKAVETAVTEYGTKYNQVINIVGSNGKAIDVLFAWIRNNDGVVRLVTAIPTK
jgi:hypothetical protein